MSDLVGNSEDRFSHDEAPFMRGFAAQNPDQRGRPYFSCDSYLCLRYLEHIIIFLFVVTAAGVVLCGIPKKRPRTSSIVQFIYFTFWSFEISRNILRNQETLSV